MANPYIGAWTRARTAAQAGRRAAPEQYLASNPFYVGPAGSPVPRWVTDPLGRTGRTPAFPDPASVPPDAELIRKPVWYPEPAGGFSPGVEPARVIPSPTGDHNLAGVIRDGGAGVASPGDMQGWDASGIPVEEPGNWWPRNPSPATQPPQAVQAAPQPASTPAPSATATPASAAAVPRGGPTQRVTGGAPAPISRKPVTMSQAYTEAQRRLQNRTPFSSRLG